MFSVVAFDLDGTLTSGEASWWLLHRRFGTTEEGEEANRLYSEGRMSYREFMVRDLACWPRPLSRQTLREALAGCALRPEAARVVDEIKRRGATPAIITAAPGLLADDVAERLGIEHVLSNGLGFDEAGYFDGSVYPNVDPLSKHVALESMAARLKVPLGRILAVGDSSYDLTFLKSAGRGLLIGDPELAARHGLPYIPDLTHVLLYV